MSQLASSMREEEHLVESQTSEVAAPRILERPEHCLSRRLLSSNALKVLYRLHRSGYTAYLVGGSVRDVLLGHRPKDFDVATNARPQEIRRLFRNSRIIGRRFRLAHVFFKGEIVEVSTFRASPEAPDSPEDWEEERGDPAEEPVSVPDETAFGTPAEDAHRRDFTVNALFYDIASFSILDYVGGLEDLDGRLLRTIGPAERRLEEDPVRMMRAVEYSARLDLRLADDLAAAIEDSAHLITEAAPARLTYELLEMMSSGRAQDICDGWRRFGILDAAFPEVARSGSRLAPLLEEIDRRVRARKRPPEGAIVACLFLPRFLDILETLRRPGSRLDNAELLGRLKEVVDPAGGRMHLSNNVVHLVKHGLFTQTKMWQPPERGRQVVKLARQEYFPVAWEVFSIGARAGLLPADSWSAWSKALGRMQHAGARKSDESVEERPTRRRRRRPRRRAKRSQS